jgi:hypothetical protein
MLTDSEMRDRIHLDALIMYVRELRKSFSFQDHLGTCDVMREAHSGASITNAIAKCNCLWDTVKEAIK